MVKWKSKIALASIFKNEEKRLQVTLDSIKGAVDGMIVFDTGSKDKTIDILEAFSKNAKIPLHLKRGNFVDFSTSRNELLAYADSFKEYDYLLLLDCNDELYGPNTTELKQDKSGVKRLREFCDLHLSNNKITAFYTEQKWWSGSITSYWNVRLIKSRSAWYYKEPIHEYITNDDSVILNNKLQAPIVLYQDRTNDDDKTGKRFVRDKDIFLEYLKKKPDNPRSWFYLGQTYECLNDKENAYKCYLKRATDYDDFFEEKFHAYLRAGNCAYIIKKPWEECLVLFMKAFEIDKRVEPLLKIGLHYNTIRDFETAFMFLKHACELEYPSDRILFIDDLAYRYVRWDALGVCSFYTKRYEIGYNACSKALATGHNVDHDTKNLKFYEGKVDKSKLVKDKIKKLKNRRFNKN
jgi:glycosyltransferase involved in cell wall biosynthesis